MLGILFSVCAVHAQEVDLVSYFRIDNPPDFVDYSGSDSETTFVDRWDYTDDFTFNGLSTIAVEQLRGATEATETLTIIYYQFDDQFWKVAGAGVPVPLGEEAFEIELSFDPPIPVKRFASIGETIQESGQSKVQLGFLPVTVNFQVTYKLLELTTLETPLGVFNDVLKVESVKLFSIPGFEERLETVEWYHPSVGMVRTESVEEGGNVVILDSVVPPLDTPVADWMIHRESESQ